MINDLEQARDRVEDIVEQLLSDCGVTAPPIDVRAMAKKKGLALGESLLEGRRGQNFRFRGRKYVEIESRDRHVRQNFTIAHEILEVEFESITSTAREKHKLATLGAPLLLMPSKWFNPACSEHNFDLFQVKPIFDTASYEAVALRMLQVEPAVVTVYDNGKITNRKTSYDFHVPRKLFPAEADSVNQVLQSGCKTVVSDDAIETAAYPVFENSFKRIILRTTFDEFG